MNNIDELLSLIGQIPEEVSKYGMIHEDIFPKGISSEQTLEQFLNELKLFENKNT